MKNKKLIIFFLSIVSLNTACVYSDYGNYFVEPIADDPPIIFVSTNLDTMYQPVVSDSLEVIYEVDIQNGDVYFVDAWVGGSRVYESDTTQASFWLYPDDAQIPGIDTLWLDIYYSTNSNSLADALELEALEFNLKYAIDFIWTFK